MVMVTLPWRDESEPATPDFASLFALPCDCGGERSCRFCDERSARFYLSPRTACILWLALDYLGMEARHEAIVYGDTPVGAEAPVRGSNPLTAVRGVPEMRVFSSLPPSTHGQGEQWRHRFADACEALAGDIAIGAWPEPRCVAEETALHLALEAAPGYADSYDILHVDLPRTAFDYDWLGCKLWIFNVRVPFIPSEYEAATIEWTEDQRRNLLLPTLPAEQWFTPFRQGRPPRPSTASNPEAPMSAEVQNEDEPLRANDIINALAALGQPLTLDPNDDLEDRHPWLLGCLLAIVDHYIAKIGERPEVHEEAADAYVTTMLGDPAVWNDPLENAHFLAHTIAVGLLRTAEEIGVIPSALADGAGHAARAAAFVLLAALEQPAGTENLRRAAEALSLAVRTVDTAQLG